jgi:hypothetical protein
MPVVIKSYHKSDMAAMYSITLNTFALWLKPFIEKKILIVEPRQKILKPNQVKIIFELLGEPDHE